MQRPGAPTAQPLPADSAEHCMECGAKLCRDDVGLHKKLVNRGAERFLCKPCLAKKFKMSIADCDHLIENFKAAGCSLFF